MLTMYIWLFNIHESPFSRSFSKSVLYESCRICRRGMLVVFVSLYGFRMVHMKLSCCFGKLLFFSVLSSSIFFFFLPSCLALLFPCSFFQLLFHLSFCCLNNSTDTEHFFFRSMCWWKDLWVVELSELRWAETFGRWIFYVHMVRFMIQSDFRQYFIYFSFGIFFSLLFEM